MKAGRGRTTGVILAVSVPLAMAVACSNLPTAPPGPFDAAASNETSAPTDAADVLAPEAGAAVPDPVDASPDVSPDVERWPSACAAQLAGSPPLEPPGSGMVLVADSRSGFSGTQGSCGWRYGYRNVAGGAAFVPMPVFEAALATWFVTSSNEAPPWTRIGRDLAHPNSHANGTRLEHWIIRRWESDVQGPVAIGVTTSKWDTCGDGVIVRLVLDGTTIYLQPLAAADTAPRKFVVSTTLKVGSLLDLVIEPFEIDHCDHTAALVRVWQ